MKAEINSFSISNNESLFKQAISSCNLVIETIRKITNVPCLPFSQVIHRHLVSLTSSFTPELKKDEDYFLNEQYPYRHHIYISIALKIMNKPETKKLLQKLYQEDTHYIAKFLALSGVAHASPAAIDPDTFLKLVTALEKGGALGKPGPPAKSPYYHIHRDVVLLNFFSSFIPAKLISLPAINQGIKSSLIAGIVQISPGIGNIIKKIDNFNPLASVFTHHTNDMRQLFREEISRYHSQQQYLHQQFIFLKNLIPLKSSHAEVQTADSHSSSSHVSASAPLLVGASAVALGQQSLVSMKTIAAITSLGFAGGMAMYRYFLSSQTTESVEHENVPITHDVSYGETPYSLNQIIPENTNRSCYKIMSDIKEVLNSDETGLRLVDKFCRYILDQNSDLIDANVESLLNKLKIDNFDSDSRTEVFTLLTHVLSILLTPSGRKKIFNLNKLIFSTSMEVNKLWLSNIKESQQASIEDALQQLRQFISESLVKEFGAIDLNKTNKLSDFILILCAPDLVQFKNNKLSGLNIISKEVYYYWNYLGRQYSDNKYVRHNEFEHALNEGKIDGFYLRRRTFYEDVSKLSPIRELFENFTSSINQEFIDFHSKDIELERLIFLTFNDIIEADYMEKGINVVKPINFDTQGLRIHLPPHRDPLFEYLRKCKNLCDVIRSFPDGMQVLWERMPLLVPESLRSYISDDTSAFVLRPHPKRDELKEKYEKIYQLTHTKHMELYKTVVAMSFEFLPDDELKFIKNSLTELNIIQLENKRIQLFRYMFMPKTFRFKSEAIQKAAYNARRHSEKGLMFSAINHQTGEKRFYAINIEASRVHRQLPIIRLSINKTEDIAKLNDDFFDEHYVFHDDKPFWDPCDKELAFKEKWTSPPEKAREFIAERYQHIKTKWCQLTRPSKKIIIKFTEKKLDRPDGSLIALQNEVINARLDFLSYEKEMIYNTTATESEHDANKGNWKLFLEKLPGYNCVELLNDLILKQEDVILTPVLENIFQGMICASDVYFFSSLAKTLKGLEHSVKKAFIQKMYKKYKINSLQQLTNSPTSSGKISPAMQLTINALKTEIRQIDAELHLTFHKISTTIMGLAGKPSEVIYPIFSFQNSRTFLFPWGAGLAKKNIKKLKSDLKLHVFHPWVKPIAKELIENENILFSSPERMNITCHSLNHLDVNSTANVFDIKAKNSALYQKMFFSALKKPESSVVIESAESGGWHFFHDYDKMAMYCFISFIIPVWDYVRKIIELENYYNLNPDKTDLNAGMLFDHLRESLEIKKPLPDRLVTSDQDLLISQSIRAIKSTLENNIQAFEFNYLFTLKHILLRDNVDLLLQCVNGIQIDKLNAHKKILDNISYLLDKTTLYSTRSAMQHRFHSAVVDHLIRYIKQAIDDNPAAITLFNTDIDTFRHRIREYGYLNADASLPSLAEFIRNDYRLQNDIEKIYQSFARIEYTSRVLTNYTTDKWLSENAQTDWFNAIQEYLSPQMRNQNIKAFLLDVTKNISAGWKKENCTNSFTDELKVLINGSINPILISLVQTAMQQCCDIYPKLLFCQYYKIENGSWFTFLSNVYMSETHQRTRRQIYSEHPFYPLPALKEKQLADIIVSPYKNRLLALHQNETRIFHQEINNIAQSFIYFSDMTFHERLYGHMLNPIAPESIAQSDAATLINSILDENGNFINYQIKILQRYFPEDASLNIDHILHLLSEIFSISWPSAPGLYDFTFQQLQNLLHTPWLTLGHLTDNNFINTQSLNLTSRYQQLIAAHYGRTPDAIQRYIAASVRIQLEFATYLTRIDPWLLSTGLKDTTAQTLCLGAIIAQHLHLKKVGQGDLLKLATIATQDMGIMPVLAQRQVALLSLPGRSDAEDALHCMATCMAHVSHRQERLLAFINDNQQLATAFSELTFNPSSPTQYPQLHTLVDIVVHSHHQLLTFALPENLEQQFRQARDRGELQFTWYFTSPPNKAADMTVTAIGLTTTNNEAGLLFPYSLPLPVSGIFRQLPQPITDEALAAICFYPHASGNISFKRTMIPALPAAADNNAETVITTFSDWLKAAVRFQLQQLARIENEAEFINRKNLTEKWLREHLPFYQANIDLAEQIRSERSIKLASSPTISQWKMRKLMTVQNMTSVNFVAKAIEHVMGSYTDWPTEALTLRTRQTTNTSIPPAELPESGFRGIWWDPMCYVCYLGFINQTDRILYASLPNNPAELYLLTDNVVHSGIWRALSLRNELQDDVTALRQGQLIAQVFFAQSVPAAWRQANGNIKERWQRVNIDTARQLIQRGIFTPQSYLLPINVRNGTSMQSTPYVLQYHSGDMVFIFAENNYQNVNYLTIDEQGDLQPLPTSFIDWPHVIHATGANTPQKAFNSTIERFVSQEKNKLRPHFLPLLSDKQQQEIIISLFNAQASQRDYSHLLSNKTTGIPFRISTNFNELSEINDYLLRHGRTLHNEIQSRVHQHIEINDNSWNVFSWRDDDIYDEIISNTTLENLKLKKEMFSALNELTQLDSFMRQTPFTWIANSIAYLTCVIDAVTWFSLPANRLTLSNEGSKQLHQDYLARNNFFNYYGEQPYITPDCFAEPWEYRFDQRRSTLVYRDWQRSLDQLSLLTTLFPAENRVIDRFLSLPDNLWQAEQMRTCANQFRQGINDMLNFWRRSHQAQQLIIIRPKPSAHMNRPISLIVSAGTGLLTGQEKAPPLLLTQDQITDLLLVNPAPRPRNSAAARLAGINTEPQTAQDFVSWTKHRLAGPVFMVELSGAAFLLRLQHRIDAVMATEAQLWGSEERDFYISASTARFLSIIDFDVTIRSHHLEFFNALFASNVLMTRLILSDPEMVFGLLCDVCITQIPEFATQNVSMAWFLFKETFEQVAEGDSTQPLYLIGV